MYSQALKEFHDAKGESNQKFIPNDPQAQHRIRLIEEECKELCDALREEDANHVLKEICDVLYVVFGTAQSYNWPVDAAFNLVHKNNMLKITYPSDEYGKYIKPKDHPKVDLRWHVSEDYPKWNKILEEEKYHRDLEFEAAQGPTEEELIAQEKYEKELNRGA